MKAVILQYVKKIQSFHREAKLFLITSFILQLLNGGYQVIFNLYLSSLGFASDFIGTVGSIRLVVGALVAIPMGILTTRIGYRRSLHITGFIILFSIFGLANTSSPALIYILSTLWGVAFVLRGIVTAPFLASYSNSENRAHLFGVTFSLHMWASMLGSFLAGSMTESFQALFGSVQAYQVALSVFGAISILGMIPVFFLKKDERNHSEKISEVLHNVVRVAKTRDIRRFMLYNGMIGMGAGLIVPLFNIFLRLRMDASDFAIGSLLSLTQIATSIGCLLTPFMIRKFGQSMSIIIAQFLSIPFLIVVGGVPYFPVVAVAYLFRTSLMNMVNPIIDSVSMQVVERKDREATSSLIKTVNNMGRGFGVYVSGMLFAGGQYMIPFVLTCALYLGGSLVFYYSFRTHAMLVNEPARTKAAKLPAPDNA